MPFKKNDSRINKNGRPAGRANRSTDELRNIFQSFLEANLDTMQRDFDQIEAKDRLLFIEKLAKLILPPPLTLENLSEMQLNQLLNKLKNDEIKIQIYEEDRNL